MYDIGNVVTIMTEDFVRLELLIVDKNIKLNEDGKVYKSDYRGLTLPLGFCSLDSFFEFDENHIHEVIYDGSFTSVINDDIQISSMVLFEEQPYLVIGFDVEYPQQQNNKLAVIKVMENEENETYTDFEIHHIDYDDVIKLTHGTLRHYNKLLKPIEARSKYVQEMMLTYKLFLPIGSVVTIKASVDENFEVMIISRNVTYENEKYDYVVCSAHTGYRNDNLCFTIDTVNIVNVLKTGYFNIKELELSRAILIENKIIERRKDE